MHRVEQWTEDADGVRYLGVKTNGITRPSIKRPIKHARSISLFSLSFRLSVRGTASVPSFFYCPSFFLLGQNRALEIDRVGDEHRGQFD